MAKSLDLKALLEVYGDLDLMCSQEPLKNIQVPLFFSYIYWLKILLFVGFRLVKFFFYLNFFHIQNFYRTTLSLKISQE